MNCSVKESLRTSVLKVIQSAGGCVKVRGFRDGRRA